MDTVLDRKLESRNLVLVTLTNELDYYAVGVNAKKILHTTYADGREMLMIILIDGSRIWRNLTDFDILKDDKGNFYKMIEYYEVDEFDCFDYYG